MQPRASKRNIAGVIRVRVCETDIPQATRKRIFDSVFNASSEAKDRVQEIAAAHPPCAAKLRGKLETTSNTAAGAGSIDRLPIISLSTDRDTNTWRMHEETFVVRR